MRNIEVYCDSAFNGISQTSKSAFVIPDDDNELAPFSLKNIFKKKDNSNTQTTKESSSNQKTNSENGSSLLNGLLGIIGVAGAIAPVLPSLGIGSKSRIRETEATAAANASIYDAQTKATLATIEAEKSQSKEIEKMIFIAIAGIVLITLLIIAARKKV